ncbi:MAG: 6-hydroxymethylpterin diphosphokinase MptE-like protein [Campylobacterota bacterium]
MLFEKNLKALLQTDPQLAANLIALKPNKRFEVYMDGNDNANVNIYDKELELTIYEDTPVAQIEKQYEEFMEKYPRFPVVFIYGIANGIFAKMVLDTDKIVVLFEPQLEMLFIAFNLVDFSHAIKSRKFKVFHERDLNYTRLNGLFSNRDIKVFLKTYDLITNTPYYENHYLQNIHDLNAKVVDQIAKVIIGDGNDAKDSLIGLDHHTKNLPRMLRSGSLLDLGSQLKKSEYAVVVSTGPSLAKQLPLLKEYKDKVTIFCIDASLPILQKEGIAPDLVFSLERVEATAKFYENLDKELLKDTIFVVSSVSHQKLLDNLEGMQTVIATRPFGYTNMFRLAHWYSLGIGMSAANMAYELAVATEIKNIALIGQDLAFGKDGMTHSKGAVYGEKEKQYKDDIEIQGFYGDIVKTSKVWVLFLHFFVKHIDEGNEKGLDTYNCTEGGAFIEGAKHIAFSDFVQKIQKDTQKPKLMLQRIDGAKQKHLLRRSKVFAQALINRTKKIKEKTDSVFLEVMEHIENLEELNAKENLEAVDYDALVETISKIDGVKEIYEEDRVIRYMQTITNPLIISAELDLATVLVKNTETQEEKKGKLVEWIYKHKSWLFFFSAALENIIFILERNTKEY